MFGIFKTYEPKVGTETKVYDLIKNLCDCVDADVRIASTVYYINCEKLHYSVIISGKTVRIVNSKFTFSETFSENKFIDALLKIIDERATKDINEIISNIEQRENNMLDDAITTLKKENGVVDSDEPIITSETIKKIYDDGFFGTTIG